MEVEGVRVITPARVRELASKVTRDELDEDAAEVIAAMADDVLVSVVSWAAEIAKARGAEQIEEQDIRKACEDEWGVTIDELEAEDR